MGEPGDDRDGGGDEFDDKFRGDLCGENRPKDHLPPTREDSFGECLELPVRLPPLRYSFGE